MTNETVKPEGTVQSSQAQPSAAATSGGRIARLSLLYVVSAVGLLTFGTALGYMFFPLHVSVTLPKTPAPPLNSSTDEDVILKTKLDYYEKRAGDLQQLSSGMLALSVLFATVAGITTYLSVSKSDRLVDEAQENLTKAASAVTEIRKEFPMIGDMNRNIMKILKELGALLDPDFLDQDRDSVFSKLSKDKRERIFFCEKTVAALSLLDLSLYSREMAKIYRGLGIFFGSKAYSYGKSVHSEDLDRAIFYLDRSNAVDSETVQTLNEKAYFIMDKTDPPSLVRAEPILLRSIDLVDNQQRARNNLAFIYTLQKRYADAVRVLEEALKRTIPKTPKSPKTVKPQPQKPK
jgi:tetratricopeptide (TPR) repeat protein